MVIVNLLDYQVSKTDQPLRATEFDLWDLLDRQWPVVVPEDHHRRVGTREVILGRAPLSEKEVLSARGYLRRLRITAMYSMVFIVISFFGLTAGAVALIVDVRSDLGILPRLLSTMIILASILGIAVGSLSLWYVMGYLKRTLNAVLEFDEPLAPAVLANVQGEYVR